MKNEPVTAFLKQFPLFQNLNVQEMVRVEEITITRAFTKKSVIFTEGSEKTAVFFIRDGLVKTYKTDEQGNEQIVSFLKAGDMFPHVGFFNTSPYPATAETIVDSHLLAIPVQQFELLLTSMPSIAVKVMRVLGNKILELQERLQVLSGSDIKQRVLSFLLILAEQHGEHADGKITINLPMTHQEFANSVGTTRETINRLLNQLSKDNLLEVDRNRIVILDMHALKQQREPK